MDLTEIVDALQEEAFGHVKDVTQAEHLRVYLEGSKGGVVEQAVKVRISYDERAQPFLVISAKRK